MAIVEVLPTKVVIAEQEPGRRRYIVTYRAKSNNVLDGPLTVLSHPLVPVIGQTNYQYGNDVDTKAFCVARSSPTKAGNNKSQFYWLFTADFVYDREMTPADMPVKIEPFYVQGTKPVPYARFLGFFKADPNPLIESPIQTAIDNPEFTIGNMKPIQNSAKIPILPVPERPHSTTGYRVSWTKKTAFDFDPFKNTLNQGPYTLVGVDSINGTVTFNKTFLPYTLLLDDVQASQRWIYDRLWYDYTVTFLHDDHRHFELDRGLAVLAGVGRPDGRGGTFTTGDFPEGVPKHRMLADANGNPISEPALLDGLGNENTGSGTTDVEPIYLGWHKHRFSNFALLPIGNTN